jgi:colicin import membrane protein
MTTLAQPISYGPSSAANPAEGRRFGGAFGVSVILHGLLLGLLIGLTITLHDKVEETHPVFELVAGEGKDYMATEAPAGSEAGTAAQGELFKAPDVPVAKAPPALDPEPDVAPTPPTLPTPPIPVPPVSPPSAPPTAQAVPAIPKTPNLARDFKRTVDRAKKKAEAESQKRIEAAERAAKAAALENKRTSLADFKKEHPAKTGATATTAATNPGKRIDVGTLKKGVTGATGADSTGAGGPAMQRAIQDAQDSYFAMLIQQLKSNHVKPEGLSDLLSADVSFRITADGEISQIRITRSSGNQAFDQSVLSSFARTGSIGPRPDKKSDVSTLTFRMKEVE